MVVLSLASSSYNWPVRHNQALLTAPHGGDGREGEGGGGEGGGEGGGGETKSQDKEGVPHDESGSGRLPLPPYLLIPSTVYQQCTHTDSSLFS